MAMDGIYELGIYPCPSSESLEPMAPSMVWRWPDIPGFQPERGPDQPIDGRRLSPCEQGTGFAGPHEV